MKVFIERENKTVNLKVKTIKEILTKLKINPETVLTIVNNELVIDDKKLSEKDEVKLLSVISGG